MAHITLLDTKVAGSKLVASKMVFPRGGFPIEGGTKTSIAVHRNVYIQETNELLMAIHCKFEFITFQNCHEHMQVI